MDPIDEAFARKNNRQAIVVIIIFAIIGANGYLIESNIRLFSVLIINLAILNILLLLWLWRVTILFEKNWRPGIDKKVAMEAAFKGHLI